MLLEVNVPVDYLLMSVDSDRVEQPLLTVVVLNSISDPVRDVLCVFKPEINLAYLS